MHSPMKNQQAISVITMVLTASLYLVSYKAALAYALSYEEPAGNLCDHDGIDSFSKPVYSQVKQNYNLYNPVPPLVNPANSKPTLSNYNQPTPYQTSFSFLHPTFVQYQEPTDPNHPSYNQIYDSPPVPYLAPKKLKPSVLYQPQSYQPAPVQNYHPIHNLLVRPSSHHRVLKDPHVKPH